MSQLQKSYPLSAAGINDCCEDIRTFTTECKMQRSDVLKLVLSVEELLLRYQSRYPDEREIRLDLSLRFSRVRMSVRIPGEAYNVIETRDDGEDGLAAFDRIMDGLVVSLTHSYKNGVNVISAEKTVESDNRFFVQLFIAIIAGLSIGLLSRYLPADYGKAFDDLLVLVNDTIMGLIKMAALPVIFLCSICGIANCGGITAFGNVAKKTLFGYFRTMFFLLLLTLVSSLCLMSFRFTLTESAAGSVSSTLSVLFTIFPDNVIAPFNNGDNIKVLFIAVMVGCALLVLGEKGDSIAKAIGDLSSVSTTIMGWVCKPIPVTIGILVIQKVRDPSSLRETLSAWQPIVVVLFVLGAAIIVDAALAARKTGIPFGTVLKHVAAPAMKGLTTGSTVTTYPDLEYTLTKNFRVDEKAVDFALPLGITFFQPTLVLLAGVTLYFAHLSGIQITPSWLLSFLLIGFFSGIAIPPVTGGVVAMLSLMFTTLGIDAGYLAFGSSLLMLIDYPNTGGRVALLALEIVRLCDSGKNKK